MKVSSMNKGEMNRNVLEKQRIISLRALVPLWFLLPVLAFAQSDPEAIKKAESFLQNDPQWRISVLSNMATQLDLNDKRALYQKYRKDPVGPFFLNLLPFAMGSAVQGDILSMQIALGADIIGWALIVFAQQLFMDPMARRNILGNLYYGEYVIGFCGGGLLVASAIFRWIAPWVYAGSYNDMLERALLLKDVPQASVPVIPMVAYVEGKDFSLGLAMRF